MNPKVKNILSIDLESWFHFYTDALKIRGFSSDSSERKSIDDNYVPQATAHILDLLDRFSQKATFFILGELYDWYPDIITVIEERGHEIGYHTHTHRILYNKRILEEELERSVNFLRRFKPAGFRAPQIIITRDSMVCLKEYGFTYSSSTYSEYRITNIDGINEIPVSSFCFRGSNCNGQKMPKPLTAGMLSREVPFGSGLFISLLGSRISYFIDSLNRNNKPAILVMHPWQFYMHKQITGFHFKLKVLQRNPLCLPYTRNIHNTVENLLKCYNFVSFRDYYE
jgi:peptidoglycan/xylan/chitin deacetylase (PgdA/CDA1 family)